MISSSLKSPKIFDTKAIKINHEHLDSVIHKYTFLHVKMQSDVDNNKIIYQNISSSNVVIINRYEEKDPDIIYFIIGFKNTIIIIEESQFLILQPLFSTKKCLKICFLPRIFDLNLQTKYEIIKSNESHFNQELQSFNYQLLLHRSCSLELKNIWKIIQPCISGYLIKEGYEKTRKNRLEKFIKNERSINSPSPMKTIDKRDFIELRFIGSGSGSVVKLGYHIEREELVAIKQLSIVDGETTKLIEREIANYSRIDHPFLPKFIGASENKELIVIEFINGTTLDINDTIQLSYKDKITIIFEMIIIVEYFHRNQLIYRDLKPNNFIVDEYKNIVLIDFDRMIKFDEISNVSTKDFASDYYAPEVVSNKFSYECDIYSLGLTIYSILELKNPLKKNVIDYINSEGYDSMKYLVKNV